MMQPSPTVGHVWLKLGLESGELSYRHGTHRTIHPKETLARITPRLLDSGITRLADVTGLDWIGIPVYQAIRPMSRNISVSQGKGLTHYQAKVSAAMEAIELYHAEELSAPTTWSNIADMRSQVSYSPETLPLMEGESIPDQIPICWVQGSNLLTGGSEWVPRDLCWLDFTASDRLSHSPFMVSSNGLASGNTIGEAILHGLFEVIERDSTARARLDAAPQFTQVDISTIRSRIVQDLVNRLLSHNVGCLIVDVTGPTGVPCFEVELHDSHLHASVWGAGCHISETTAMIRAITEACQTRLSYIAGTRDDLSFPDPDISDPAEPGHISSCLPDIEVAPLGSRPPFRCPPTTIGQIQELSERVFRLTGSSPIAVDLSIPSIDIPVVFVVAPGLLFDASHRSLRNSWKRIPSP